MTGNPALLRGLLCALRREKGTAEAEKGRCVCVNCASNSKNILDCKMQYPYNNYKLNINFMGSIQVQLYS